MFSPEELEEMRRADAEIEAESDRSATAAVENEEMDKWLDELATIDQLDHRTLHTRKRQQKYSRAYYEAHKDEIAAKMRAYREAHKDELAAKMRAYYEAHKDEIAAKHRAYREAHKDAHRKYMRQYMRQHRKDRREGIRRRTHVMGGPESE